MSKNGSDIKKGHYWAVKVRGTGGDLILGRVQSYRKGAVVLDNLLSGGLSNKREHVLRQRNKRITKKEADKILKLHKAGASKKDVREAAVMAPEVGAKQIKLQVPLDLSLCRDPEKTLQEKLEYLAAQFIKDVLKLVETK